MRRELSFDFCQVTEAAALASYKWLGLGDKNAADASAVDAMRVELNDLQINGEIVIGEGEIDEAPMLYIGELVGDGGDCIDIAVDPIDGTRMTALGQSNAVAVLAACDKGGFLRAPDMYMEKLVVGSNAKGTIDLNCSLKENIARIANAIGKSYKELTCITLAKTRHDSAIHMMRDMGLRVYAVPDGDIVASILTCMPENHIDFLYCIGGAPEGVISAAAVRALDGDMNARLIPRDVAKGSNPENLQKSKEEVARCLNMGIEPMSVLKLNDMVRNDSSVISLTGITGGELLSGVSINNGIATTETILIRSRSRTIRRIYSEHNLIHKKRYSRD